MSILLSELIFGVALVPAFLKRLQEQIGFHHVKKLKNNYEIGSIHVLFSYDKIIK